MPCRYFFHAPDGRIYGPAPMEALRRWRDEGRLRADSRLRAEGGDDVFLTYDEVERKEAALPPCPEPPASAVPIDAPPQADPQPAAPEFPVLPSPLPLPSLIRGAARLAGRAWRPLWPALLVMQVPTIAFTASQPYFHLAIDPATKMLSMKHAQVLFLAVLGLAAWGFFFNAFLTLALRDLRERLPVSPARTWREISPRIGSLLWTFFLAAGVLLAWGALTFLLLGAAAALHGFLAGVVLVTAVLSAVPTCLLALRCLILPQVAALEERRGLGALRRAIELVRLSSRNTLFSDSDLRLFALAFLALFLLPLGLLALFNAVALLPLPGRLLLVLLELGNVVGSAALALFFSSLFLHFFEDVRRRLRVAGVDPA